MSHGDCPRHLRCTNGYCGDRKYFEALRERQCEDDGVCEVRLETTGALAQSLASDIAAVVDG